VSKGRQNPLAVVIGALVLLFCAPARAEEPVEVAVPVDWSHQHLIITNRATLQERMAASRDPRALTNAVRRTQAMMADGQQSRNVKHHGAGSSRKMQRDWSVSMGAGRVAPGMSPAKYGFAMSSTFLIASCTTDYAVYGLDVAGTVNTPGSQANLVGLRNLYSGSAGYCGLASIAAAGVPGASRAGNVVTITTTAPHSFTVGMQVAIAGVANVGFNGTFTVASVPSATAFTYTQVAANATSGGGTASFATASVAFAYNITTAAGGRILTSPSISLDGTKIAFVESTGTASIFHVLTLDPCVTSVAGCSNNGTSATSSAVPGNGNAASMVSITYSNSSNTRSSPWIDYSPAGDAAYVGDDNGTLYRIKGVFYGTPALDGTFGGSGSIVVSSGLQLLGPVLAQGWLMVGDSSGTIKAVLASSPFTVASSTFAVGTGMGDPPVVDASTTGVLSVFETAASGFTIEQGIFNTSSQQFTSTTSVSIGHSAAGNAHAPALDNNYLLGRIDATHGFIYACGALGGSQHPVLYRLGFTAGSPPTMSATSVKGPTLANSNAECSPLTEFANPNIAVKDLLFVGDTSGEVQSFDITGAMPAAPAAGPVTESGGTSGIIVDTTQLGANQGSSIYFTTLGNAGNCGANNYCAIKLTQNGLQ